MSKRNGQLKPGRLYLLEIKPDKPISREVAKLLAEELLKKQTELNVSFKSISIRAERISLQLRPQVVGLAAPYLIPAILVILGLFGIAAVAYSLRELLPTIPEWVPPVAMLGALGFVLYGASRLRE